MNTIDIVIPTMWRVENFASCLESYIESEHVLNIFVVDNNHRQRPSLPKDKKITLINYNRNIYVNPAWNEGYSRSHADVLCLLNDDVRVDLGIFDLIAHWDFANTDLIGVSLKFGSNNFEIGKHASDRDEILPLKTNFNQPVGGLAWAFGVCMFVKRSAYRRIPSLYQIWFGDDYLVQHCQTVSVLKTNRITGEISRTLVDQENNADLQRRMSLDAQNVARFNHFKNGKNWKLVRDTIAARSGYNLRNNRNIQ